MSAITAETHKNETPALIKMDNAICRICLNSSVTLVDIFAKREQLYNGQPEPCLADMLNECADCHIKSNDALPQQICLSCVLSAQNAFRFKRTCEENYRQLLARHRDNAKSKLPAKADKRNTPKEKLKNADKGQLLEVPIKQEPVVKTEANSELYKCPSCSKEFAHLSILRVHKRWHRQNKIASKSMPKAKVKAIAAGKTKECPTCHKKCRTDAHLKKHLCTHSKARPFECVLCSNTFQFNSHLKRHMRNHTGERPYQCPHCPEDFPRSDYCRAHMKKVHSGLKYTGKLIRKT